MQFHTPTSTKRVALPTFVIKNGELVCPEKIYTKDEYPNLRHDMVKITAQNGQKIFVNRSKVSAMDV